MIKPCKLVNNNFLSSLDLSTEEAIHIFELSSKFKNKDLNIKIAKIVQTYILQTKRFLMRI